LPESRKVPEIVTHGTAAHGSTPHLGVNAIHKLIDVLQRAQTDLPMSSDPNLRQTTWNLGHLDGGTVPNIVPAQASATIDHRTVATEKTCCAGGHHSTTSRGPTLELLMLPR
jgi:succinyl-diaminopimelate desuccinylase